MRRKGTGTVRGWRKQRMIGGTVVLLLLAGIGLPNLRAQRPGADPAPSGVSGEGAQAAYYSRPSLFNQGHTPRKAPPQQGAGSAPQATPLLSPDHDLGYPLAYPPAVAVAPSFSVPPTDSVTRSYYPGSAVPAVPPPADILRASSLLPPHDYSLEAAPLDREVPAANPRAALLVRLPDDALLWVEGQPIRRGGRPPYFRSPPLVPGKRYSYTVRAAWVEDGRWVGQTLKVPVRAGLVESLSLRPR